MRTFRRYSSALKRAADRDIIRVSIAREQLFIVPGDAYNDAVEEIAILASDPERPNIGRVVAGSLTPRDLKRLGIASAKDRSKPPRRTTRRS